MTFAPDTGRAVAYRMPRGFARNVVIVLTHDREILVIPPTIASVEMVWAAAPPTPPRSAPSAHRWTVLERTAFRCFFVLTVYFSLVSLGPDVLGRLPFGEKLSALWWSSIVDAHWRPVVRWIARHVFKITIRSAETYELMNVFTISILSSIVVTVWSTSARQRTAHPDLFRWLRAYCRFAAATILLSYGMSKVLLTQADYPQTPSALLTPLGALNPFTYYFALLATSPVYQAFAGSVEMLAGFLLISQRTVLLGALVTCAAMANVVIVNWAFEIAMYRVSVTTFALALFLIVPDLRRLLHMFVLGNGTSASELEPMFASSRGHAIARGLGIGYLLLELSFLYHRDRTEGMHWLPRPPLYGA